MTAKCFFSGADAFSQLLCCVYRLTLRSYIFITGFFMVKVCKRGEEVRNMAAVKVGIICV